MTADDRASDEPIIIRPVAFRGAGRAPAPRRPWWRMLIPAALVVLVLALAVAGWFVVTARQIEIAFDPPADRVELDGPLPHFRLSGSYLLRQGSYRVRAERQGYHALEADFVVGAGADTQLHFTLEKLPGRLDVRTAGADAPDVPLPGVEVEIDGAAAGTTPLAAVELAPGVHMLRLRHDRYQTIETQIDIEGEGRGQEVALELRPNWADVDIATRPVPAEVWIDGVARAMTPCRIPLDAGAHELELRADGFEVWRRRLEIIAETPVVMDDVVLEPARGRLVIATRPPGAHVTVDGAYVGMAPLETTVPPDVEIAVHAARDGYDPIAEVVRLAPGEVVDVELVLAPQVGTVRFEVTPADATLYVDGVRWGAVPSELSLPSVPHELGFRKDGFVTATLTVHPRPELAQRIVAKLEPVRRSLPPEAQDITAVNGALLKLVRPAEYVMGSSRREPGRRSNETLRTIRLERPFYMGVREITNEEFRAFRADHQSGTFETARLDGGSRPVVQVTWDDAARFCNWLSARDRLPPAYVEREGVMESMRPLTHGYRLPTEAEWEYCARADGAGGLLKYPWGAAFPPPAPSGNYADESAARLLALTIPGYDDGHAAAAPVASFDANVGGLHDLGGNVAEWCHDFYAIEPYDEQQVAVDPVGPERGRHHVIRGSSWRDASISALRLSYRNYGAEPRDDVGFRICRYLSSPQESP